MQLSILGQSFKIPRGTKITKKYIQKFKKNYENMCIEDTTQLLEDKTAE